MGLVYIEMNDPHTVEVTPQSLRLGARPRSSRAEVQVAKGPAGIFSRAL